MVARARERRDREMERRHAARRRDRPDAALERGEALFEDRDGRVRDATVDVAGALEIEQRRRMLGVAVDVGGRFVDRDGARAVGRIGPLPRVEGEGVERRGSRSRHVVASTQAKTPPPPGRAAIGARARRP